VTVADDAARKRQRVVALLESLGIRYGLVEHPALFSGNDHEVHRVEIDAVIFKNLFLRNKNKSRYYLYSLPLDKRADLPALQRAIGATRLSFGNEDELWEKLCIRPGSVSLLNIVDAPDTDVEFLVDSDILTIPRFSVHPNDNRASVILTAQDIPPIFDHFGAAYRFVDSPLP
jgi:Ala-tRNA(Pro) deacylase